MLLLPRVIRFGVWAAIGRGFAVFTGWGRMVGWMLWVRGGISSGIRVGGRVGGVQEICQGGELAGVQD